MKPAPFPPPPAAGGQPVLDYSALPPQRGERQSVWDEPQMRAPAPPDPQDVEHSVWDEPALAPELARAAADADATYAGWLQSRRESTTALRSWLICLGVAVAAGPWAVLGAFWNAAEVSGYGALAMIVLAPVIEELMKVSLPMYLVEKRPYLFRSALQIALCALAGGAAFAAIENLLYLNVYIPSPSVELVRWRWTVCVALHMGCSLLAGMGLALAWREGMDRSARPRMSRAAGLLTAAMVVHGAYNAFAWVIQAIAPF